MRYKENLWLLSIMYSAFVACFLLWEGKKVEMSPNITDTVNVHTFFFFKLTLEVRLSP